MYQQPQGSASREFFLQNRSALHLFHYHLVTSNVREVEARYLARLGFRLVARYGRIGEEQVHYEAGVSWEELERMGFRHRLSELERGAVNVVVQPGQWPLPRVDHLGVALDDDEFQDVLERATELRFRVQEYPGRRTFVATDAGYRVEVHPQRDWIGEATVRFLEGGPRGRPELYAELFA